MVESTTLKNSRADQCRQNALNKSQQKRQAVLDAIATLQQQNIPVTRSSVARYANVSYPFLAKHIDLQQAIDEAAESGRATRQASELNTRGKDVAIAAMQRQMEKLKQQVKEKDAELRRKQREIDHLYGKLASRSESTDPELRRRLAEVTKQLHEYQDREHNEPTYQM